MMIAERAQGHLSHSYLLLRLGVGLTFAIHGALRFSQESYFTDLLVMLNAEAGPDYLMVLYAYIMPGIELIAGFLLCFGFMKRIAITGLATVMIVWILSSILFEYWQNMASQLLFFFILYWLYFKIHDDQWSFDSFLKH
jgi:uncharacterized membrane protein YphA (DoxX/SURF4 family)